MTFATQAATATQVYQLYIRASQQEVWDAITDPAIVAKFFFGAQVESTYEVGSKIRSVSPDGSDTWGDNTILECDPPRRLVHTWRSLYDPVMAAEPESLVQIPLAAAQYQARPHEPAPRTSQVSQTAQAGNSVQLAAAILRG